MFKSLTCIFVLIGCVCFLSPPSVLAQRGGSRSGQLDSIQGQTELQRGIELSQKGQFQEAIPHLRAAQAQMRDSYAAAFNLALCYVGTQQFSEAVALLQELRLASHDTAEVENLLAQSYVGVGQTDNAFAAEQRSAELAPKNEKLYIFAADACMESGNYELGLKIVTLGVKSLPNSARLAFERGMFLSQMDEFDIARGDFRRVQELAPNTEIAYIARAQQSLLEGNMAEAAKVAREAIEKGNSHFLLLTIFGEATLASGAAPGQPDFADAQEALERVARTHPNFAGAQLSLGKLYVQTNRIDDAIAHLEVARRLDSRNPAVYANLATAYRMAGNSERASEATAELAKLNQEQAEKIGSEPGERKAGYASHVASKPPNP